MKAVVCTQYGSPDVLRLTEMPKPSPKDNEVLIEVRATGINAADWRLLRGEPFLVRLMYGLFRPKVSIFGGTVSGRVVAIGKNVTQFGPDMDVFGDLSSSGFGGLADYVCAPEHALALKPINLSHEEAAAVPLAATTALQALRDVAKVQPGQRVLIYGASGGVGTFAVQIAKALGAQVTAVCSTSKMNTARALGADHVIDYTREDFSRNGQTYDVILAVNGNRKLADYARALTPTGTYVMAGGDAAQLFEALAMGPIKTKRGGKAFRTVSAKANQADLATLAGMIEAGKVRPVMDRCYPLDQAPEAIRYMEAGHAKGRVVVTVA